MIDNLDEVVSDARILSNRCILREGFVFTSIGEPSNVYDALVVRNPENAQTEWRLERSQHSLEEHVNLINVLKIKKALVFADNFKFLTRCMPLREIAIFPSNTFEKNIDFSPLYKLRNINKIFIQTSSDKEYQNIIEIDYSKFNNLRHLDISGKGHLNYHKLNDLEYLSISNNNELQNFSNFECKKSLKELDLLQCGIRTMKGIGEFCSLQRLHLAYDRVLEDVTDVEKCFQSMRVLTIKNCPRITDFSFLEKMVNLEHLELYGINKLSNLDFLSKMQKLKTFSFSMTVSNGDLTPCLFIPYVNLAKGRKNYNLKDSDLPKNIDEV